MNNPFNLDFGAEPNLYIPRDAERGKVLDAFKSEMPTSHIFLLLGARGTGKTVLMTSISHELRQDKDWIHVDLNVESNMLETLAAGLYENTKKKLPKVKLSLSVKGISVTMEKDEKYSNVQNDIDSMLKLLAKHNLKLLVTVDEANNSQKVRELTTYFQHAIREKLPIFMIMTGLYKNVRSLQNNRSQTFLRRAPKINLGELNLTRIARQYETAFGIDHERAYNMAMLTKGYSYGFQILGYLTCDAGKNYPDDDVLFEYRLNLSECSYDKIWEELSENERAIARAIARSDNSIAIKEIREMVDMDSNNFSTYKDTLEKSGILSKGAAYGRVEFALPYFKEYANEH